MEKKLMIGITSHIMVRLFALSAALLLLFSVNAAQAQDALAGIEGALGNIDIEALIPDAIGGIVGGPIAIVINLIANYLCTIPLLL